jgi:hypothetical protein
VIKPSNNKIIVSVDFRQKEKISVAGNDFLLGKQYSHNRRESMPVLCQVVDGNGHIKEGTFLLVHHNRFGEHSAHALGNNQYSLAYNESIFARVDSEGNAHGLCGNVIVDYIYPEYSIPVPAHLRQPDKFKYKVLSKGFGYNKGQIIFAYEFSNYEIVYVFNGAEKRVVKIKSGDIVGKIAK